MTMPVSEKSFLEKLAGYLPGIRGYREREGRRETDRRLREFLAGRLEDGRARLNALREGAADAGALTGLDALGRLDRTLQKSIASLRYADAGYSGVFDQVKIREAELDQIYAYDAALVAEIVQLSDGLRAAGDASALAPLAAGAEQLDLKIARRREILEKPAV
ncbi:MAG TPA: hypothetical protein VFB67_08100 [Candidatus Polarisedimenticolaceae bacterium]|nr:hypothetical protein [Candidatus Polarisedimenticolaceae bacterium]